MAFTIQRASGLRITLPDTYTVSEPETPGKPKRRAPLAFPRGPIPLPAQPTAAASQNAVILDVLKDQDMELVDTVQMDPSLEPTPPSGRRRAAAPKIADEQPLEFELDLAPGEEAVLLLEQDGVYSWNFPSGSEPLSGPATRRGAGAKTAGKRVQFRIEVHSSRPPDRNSDRRRFFKDFLYDRVRAFVLKFVAKVAVETAMAHLERGVEKGLVEIDSFDPARWGRVKDLSKVTLPEGRSARVLLFIHGTFSSTAGSFGTLGSTPWGQEFLKGAWTSYDAVLGFDHATLSEDPRANALDLLKRLRGAGEKAPRFDVIGFSRGGLVFRSLVEDVLPSSPWQPEFGPVAFVAVPNAGTRLAQPANWQRLADLYTNLAIASCTVLDLMPHALSVSLMLKEVAKGLGALVKYLAAYTVTQDGVPGLAAMDPDGVYVKKINEIQPGRPDVTHTSYYAVTSEFAAKIVGGDHEPKELPLRLVMALTEGFVDQVMLEANDLVVNTPSMTAVHPQVPGYIKDSLNFGKTPQVYHLTYFLRPEVINALTRWLRLSRPAEVPPKRKPAARPTRGGGRPAPAPSSRRSPARGEPSAFPDLVELGAAVEPELPAALDTDILILNAADHVNDVLEAINAQSPSYVVIRREEGGAKYEYACGGEEILAKTLHVQPNESLAEALRLHDRFSTVVRPFST